MESATNQSTLPFSFPLPPPPIPNHGRPRVWDEDPAPKTPISTTSLTPREKTFDIEAAIQRVMTEHDANARPRYFSTAFEEWIFVFTVMLACSSTTFLQGVIIINTATIGKDLRMTDAQITWIAAAIG